MNESLDNGNLGGAVPRRGCESVMFVSARVEEHGTAAATDHNPNDDSVAISGHALSFPPSFLPLDDFFPQSRRLLLSVAVFRPLGASPSRISVQR